MIALPLRVCSHIASMCDLMGFIQSLALKNLLVGLLYVRLSNSQAFFANTGPWESGEKVYAATIYKFYLFVRQQQIIGTS